MGEMNFLEKLLDGVNVEWRPLSEALNRTKGTKITAAQMRELHKEGAPIKIFAGGKTYAFFDFSDIPKKDINEEPSIIVKSRGFIEFEYYDKPFSHKNEMWSYNANGKQLDIKFVYYFLKVHEPYFQNIGSKMQMPQISIPDTDNFRIPIPCPENPKKSLEIQAEIVRILDAMTAHTAELTAELTARKKQYDYYRDKLLSFEEGEVEWKSLGDMAFICDGTHQTPTYTQEGVPFVSVENIKNISASKKRISFEDFEKYKYKPQKNDLLMTRIGDIGSCAIVDNDNPLAYYVTLALIRLNQEVMLPKYLKYVIESHIGVRELRKRTLVNASPIKINLGEIGKIILPVPSTKEQARIVAILDKFDALTSSLTEGLPREIELRQKQYAYYRDLLLSFPAAQAA